MIPTTRINKHYDYKDIHGYVYLIQIDQIEQIIRIRDTRFYKDNLEAGDFQKKKIYETIFDEFDEKKEDNI